MAKVAYTLVHCTDSNTIDYVVFFNLNSFLSKILTNRNAHILVGVDLNCGGKEPSNKQMSHSMRKGQSQQQNLNIIVEHSLTQIVNIPMRNDTK